MSLLPDKYTKVYALQPGQNAKVFKATNTLLSRDVFLKIYPIPKDDPLSALREPHLLTELAHLNLVAIYTADPLVDGESIVLEMELLRDGSLDELLKRCIETGRWIGIHKVISISRDIVTGLNHLHGHGYVHRDIKPANVMIRNRGALVEGVITDLGLVSKLDAEGHALGTQHARLYRPPEVWAGEPYTKASDLYQLGLVLYQLLGGQINYQLAQLSDDDLGPAIISGTLVDFDSVGVHVGPALHRLIVQLACPLPGRISDCNVLIAMLQKLQRDHRDWHLRDVAPTLDVLRQDGAREFKVSIASEDKNHTIQVYERYSNRNWRRKGKAISLKHKSLRRCRQVRALLDK